MYLRLKYLPLLVAPLLTLGMGAQAMPATSHKEVDVAVTFTEQYSNLVSTPTFWQEGGSLELSSQTYRGFGAAANVTGTNVNRAANSGYSLSIVTATFGPRYTWYKRVGVEKKRSIAIFGQGLIGESNAFNSFFPSPAGVMTKTNSFALNVGGGVDIGISRHFAIRAFQADWLRTQYPNATTNVQNNMRLSAGVVLRMPQAR